MLYSFPRSQRFYKNASHSCDKFYDLPKALSNRSAAFGYGKKYDFTQGRQKVPSPNEYNVNSLFDYGKTHNKGFSIGESRDKLQLQGPLAGLKKNIGPGPGKYNLPSTLSKQKWSMRIKPPRALQSSHYSPGPGAYNALFSINERGEYFSSKYKNSCASLIDPTSKGKHQHLKQPGPGCYDLSKSSINKEGRYFNSKHVSRVGNSFSKAARRTIDISSHTPGPGNYSFYSEFGFVKFVAGGSAAPNEAK